MSTHVPKCTSCQKCDDTHIAIPDNLLSTCPSSTRNCEACTRVKKLTKEVEEAAEKLKQLIVLLQRAKTEMNHHHSTAVSKLPPEILSIIFELHTSDALPPSLQDEIHLEVPQHSILPIPLVLSHVCHRWRQVAFSTPQIWTTLTIFLDLCDGSPAEEDFMSAWISRTRNHPLTIHLHSSLEEDYDTDHPEDSRLPVLQVLASSSRQWRHFSARVPTYILDYLGTEAQDIPLMETFGIRLRALDMDEDGLFTRPLWKAVTTMRIENVNTEDCAMLLSSTPNLVTCIFDDIQEVYDEELWQDDQLVVEHPKIQHLTYESLISCDIFERLKLPNLKSLKCASRGFLEDASTILPDFFANSGMEKLEVLVLPHNHFEADQLISLLSMAPALTHFSCLCTGDYGEFINDLLEHLAETAVINSPGQQPSPRIFLPNLTSLEFNVQDGQCFPWDNVAACFPRVVDSESNLTKQVEYRPLSTFKVFDKDITPEEPDDQGWGWQIPGDTLEDLIALMQGGVEIVYKGNEEHDLLELSMENAGMDLKIYARYVQGIQERLFESN